MNTTTDITVLDHILALNLDVNIWSARKKLTPEDFGGAQLPPEELASLGSKKVCNPEELRIFGTLKARAVNLLDRHGVRFLGGWGIPEDRAKDILVELTTIRDDFLTAKETFLRRYDQAVRDWIDQHPGWEQLIGSSMVSAEYVRSRMGFAWQVFKLAAPAETAIHDGLKQEVSELGTTLFHEVAKSATEAWNRCYVGRDKVTHKALSPLRTLHSKLLGLSFVEPRVLPVADLMQTAFDQIPARGMIQGAHLLMLQGLVALLRDPQSMIEHGQKILDGNTASDLLNGLVSQPQAVPEPDPIQPENISAIPNHSHQIDSHGLW